MKFRKKLPIAICKGVLYYLFISSACYGASSDSKSTSHVYKDKPKVDAPIYVAGISRLAPDLACLKLNNQVSNLTAYGYYQNVAFDPQITINPKNPKNMLVVVQQDALANGNYYTSFPLASTVLYTLDGGKTWNESVLALSRCQEAGDYRANDDFMSSYLPAVSFDKEGNGYVLSSSYNLLPANRMPTISYEEANVIAKTVDGGISWIRETATTRDDGLCHYLDFPHMKADPYRKNTVYVATSDNTCFVSDTCTDPNYTGNQYILFQKSTDGGTSWSPSTTVASFVPNDPVACTPIPMWHQLEVLPDSTKTVILSSLIQQTPPDSLDATAYDQIYLWRSKDEGATWERHTVDNSIPNVLVIDPDSVDPLLPVTDFTTKDMAVNHYNGYVYIVYSDSRFNPTGQAGAVIRMSKDGGKNWSKPRPINPKTLNEQTFLPTVAVAKDGTVGVLFYDFRNHTPDSAELSTDVWMSLFDKELKHYYGEVRLTEQSFDTRKSIRGYNGVDFENCSFDYYLSNHVGLQARENDFLAVFTVTSNACEIGGVGAFPCDSFPFTTDSCNRQNVIFVHIHRH